jgi:hypothetical protein
MQFFQFWRADGSWQMDGPFACHSFFPLDLPASLLSQPARLEYAASALCICLDRSVCRSNGFL